MLRGTLIANELHEWKTSEMPLAEGRQKSLLAVLCQAKLVQDHSNSLDDFFRLSQSLTIHCLWLETSMESPWSIPTLGCGALGIVALVFSSQMAKGSPREEKLRPGLMSCN